MNDVKSEKSAGHCWPGNVQSLEASSSVPQRKCVMLVVDAIAHRIVKKGLEEARYPHLSEVVRRGGSFSRCLSIFPSITPAATCTLATGVYPSSHGVEGAFWFDPEQEEVAYFGDDFQLLRARGLHEYLVDFGDRLNRDRLRAPTIFEQLEAMAVRSSCINFMWFRGSTVHPRHTPLTLRMLAGSLSDSVSGPAYLKLGDFVESLPPDVDSVRGGPLGRYGFSDQVTGQTLLSLVRQNALTPFTLGYFPENDDRSHDDSPEVAAVTVLEPFDDWLGEFVQAYGGWDRVERELALVIVGDHGQNTMHRDDETQSIRIDTLLSEYRLASYDTGWEPGDEMFVCPNMRACAIHPRDETNIDVPKRMEIARVLLADDRIDQVIFPVSNPSHDGRKVQSEKLTRGHVDARRFRVVTADRGTLEFQWIDPNGGRVNRPGVEDRFGNRWMIEGDCRALDLTLSREEVNDGMYPNALERIAGAFAVDRAPIFVTAKPGHEFQISETSVHSGGSHGSLCKDDTEAALLTLGCGLRPDQDVRSVDVLGICMRAIFESAQVEKAASELA